jgi:hypothetical protein
MLVMALNDDDMMLNRCVYDKDGLSLAISSPRCVRHASKEPYSMGMASGNINIFGVCLVARMIFLHLWNLAP